MGRWEPNARGRLERAALALFVEHGYDATTVAQIADRAGLTKSTFFRHFADKREVLFGGQDQHLYVNKTDGPNLLNFKVKGPVSGGVAISNNRVYFATSLGYLYCMSPNGK